MTFKKILLISLIASVSVLGGCDRKAKKSVAEKVKHEAGVRDHKEIAQKGMDAIKNHKTLTEEQKTGLIKINMETAQKAKALRFEIGQVKGVFFKSMLGEAPDDAEMRVLRKKLLKLNDDKMRIMLDSFDKVRKLLGNSKNVDEIYRIYYDPVM